jgi:hypothetical protein
MKPTTTALLITCASVAALSMLLAPGCSYATLNGYDVVQSDMEVEYEPGPMGLQTTAGGDVATHPGPSDAFSRAHFERSLEGALAQNAPDYRFVAPSAEPEHTVRVGAVEVTPVADGTEVTGNVEIVDREGRVTSELHVEHTVPRGQDVDAQAGEVFGARIAHYLENRERYHW